MLFMEVIASDMRRIRGLTVARDPAVIPRLASAFDQIDICVVASRIRPPISRTER